MQVGQGAIAIPIPSGMTSNRINTTNPTTASFLPTGDTLARAAPALHAHGGCYRVQLLSSEPWSPTAVSAPSTRPTAVEKVAAGTLARTSPGGILRPVPVNTYEAGVARQLMEDVHSPRSST